MRFLFVDRIVEMTPGDMVRGVKHVTQDDAYLRLDEQGRPFFIPSLIGETLGQLAAWNVMYHNDFTMRPVAGVVSSATWYRPAYVGETLLLESFIENLDDRAVQYHSVASVGNEVVFKVEGALGPLLPMQDFIDRPTIVQQFSEIYRLGDWASYQNLSVSVNPKQVSTDLIPKASPMTFDSYQLNQDDLSMTAVKRISRAAEYFADHFPNKPVLPMTVLLECKLNLASQWMQAAGLAGQWTVSEFRKIKMNEFVQPGDALVCQVKVKEQNENEVILSYRSEVDGKRVCVVEIVLIPKGY